MTDTTTRLGKALSQCKGMGRRPTGLWIIVLAALLTGCGGGASSNRADFSSTWPQWQQIEATQPPSAWQVEEASFAFDAWEALAVVTKLSAFDDATVIRFDDEAGNALEVRLAAIPSAPYVPTLAAGDTVRVLLIRREGFEGVAQGLTVSDRAGQLLLLYDDGGYGAAFYQDGARAGLGVEQASNAGGAGDKWATVDAKFQLDGDSIVLGEGQFGRLGGTGLVVMVVVSREWTGPPMTDVDPSILAYLVFRADGE